MKKPTITCKRCGKRLIIETFSEDTGEMDIEILPCPKCTMEYYNNGYNIGYHQKTEEMRDIF